MKKKHLPYLLGLVIVFIIANNNAPLGMSLTDNPLQFFTQLTGTTAWLVYGLLYIIIMFIAITLFFRTSPGR